MIEGEHLCFGACPQTLIIWQSYLKSLNKHEFRFIGQNVDGLAFQLPLAEQYGVKIFNIASQTIFNLITIIVAHKHLRKFALVAECALCKHLFQLLAYTLWVTIVVVVKYNTLAISLACIILDNHIASC